jgi:hypothetical protein
MEASGQCHAPAALYPGKRIPVPFGYEAGWALEPYRTIIRPVDTYGSETWCLTANDERSLRTWERKKN